MVATPGTYVFNDSLMQGVPPLSTIVRLTLGNRLAKHRALPQGGPIDCLDTRPSHQLLRDKAFQELAADRNSQVYACISEGFVPDVLAR